MSSAMSPYEAFEKHAAEMQERLRKRPRGRTLLLLAAPFVAIMLLIAALGTRGSDAHRTVTEAAQRWADQGPSDYSVTYRLVVADEAYGPATAVVEAGLLVGFVTDDPTLEDSRVLTVEQAFFAIEDVVTRGGTATADYHPDLGYTMSASLDPDPQVGGDEWSFEVIDFQPVGGS